VTASGLRDAVVLVTGAGKGIGRATAFAFAEERAQVVCAARTLSDVEAVAAQIRGAGSDALALACDVALEDQVRAMVAKTIERFGRIDVLVNNAGGTGGKWAELADLDFAQFDAVVAANLRGTALCSKYALKHMLAQQRGAIVNLSSTWGRTAGPGLSAYVAAKWGVIGLTQAIAVETATRGVRANCVVPGYTRTEMIERVRAARVGTAREVTAEQIVAEMAELAPQKRVVEPAEVADMIVYLASDHAKSITGQTVNVNAGLFMN
jgi:NAD(P)-dependent dehydrogenase (short-subunit alcohol dehydrogenase family)